MQRNFSGKEPYPLLDLKTSSSPGKLIFMWLTLIFFSITSFATANPNQEISRLHGEWISIGWLDADHEDPAFKEDKFIKWADRPPECIHDPRTFEFRGCFKLSLRSLIIDTKANELRDSHYNGLGYSYVWQIETVETGYRFTRRDNSPSYQPDFRVFFDEEVGYILHRLDHSESPHAYPQYKYIVYMRNPRVS